MFRGKGVFWSLSLLLCFATAMYSQSTFASITGLVQDSSGAVVPNVKITATNLETNIKSTAVSNGAGNYTIAQLKEGRYALRADASGFMAFVVQDIVLAALDVRRVDIALEVGSVGTVVQVTGGATLIETETARISDLKTGVQLNTLPLNSRGVWPFLILGPGLVQQATDSGLRFAGSRVGQSNWAMDGTSFANGVDNTQMGPLANYVEAFQEVKIDMANNTAEFGSLGQVTIITKSGTNSLHGSAFWYYSTPVFRARNPFALERDSGIYHFPGGSIGGPVYLPKIYDGRNRTFFYYANESERDSVYPQLFNPTVPIQAWRNGDFSGAGVTIYDPQSGQPFPGNKIPASRINPVSKNLQGLYYPLPNFGDPNVFAAQNYREVKSAPAFEGVFNNIRIDHRFSDKDSVFARVSWQHNYFYWYADTVPTTGVYPDLRKNRSVTIPETHIFSPTMVNEFRFGFATDTLWGGPPNNGAQFTKDLGLVGLAPNLPDLGGYLNLSFNGVGIDPVLGYPFYNPAPTPSYKVEEFQDHLSWFKNRHNLKFGFNLLRATRARYEADQNLFGSVTFDSTFTNGGNPDQGHPYADFLLGIPTSMSRAFPPLRQDSRRWAYDFFALDDFKVNSRLTLNLGLRYQLHLPWHSDTDRIAMFDIGSGNIVVPDGALSQVSPIFPKNYVGIVQASSLGLPRSLVRPDKNNFDPRLGIAYRPWGPMTVFRMGFGVFHDVTPFADYAVNSVSVPFILNEPEYTNPTTNPDVIFPRVFPDSGSGGPSAVSLPPAINPNITVPYSLQYNFTVEHQVKGMGFRVSYIGTNTRQAFWSYNYNSPIPDQRLFTDKPRPYPQYPDISYVTNGAGHQYNALMVQALRQLKGGLMFQSSWTWARDLYDLDYGVDSSPENPFDRHREFGVSRDIPTHRFTTNWIYQLPFGERPALGLGCVAVEQPPDRRMGNQRHF